MKDGADAEPGMGRNDRSGLRETDGFGFPAVMIGGIMRQWNTVRNMVVGANV